MHDLNDLNNDNSPWHDTPTSTATPPHAEAEWAKLSSDFQTAGYRDGITAGKEAALQEGFDAGFAQAGVPCGRELGLLRGLAGALLLHLTRVAAAHDAAAATPSAAESSSAASAVHAAPHVRALIRAVREIVDALATVRFADIAPSPPPEETVHLHAHATGNDASKSRRNNNDDEQNSGGDDGGKKKEEEEEEEELASANAMTIEDVRALRIKLEAVLREAAIKVDVNLEPFDP